MGKITIAAVIGFFIAISIFLIQSHVQETVEDAMLDATGEIVKGSPIDDTTKTALSSTLGTYKLLGIVAFIGGAIAIFKKFF